MNFDDTLVVAAHPDDEVLGVGGFIAKNSAKRLRVDVLVVTDGTSTQYPGNTGMREERSKQLTEACRLLGASSVTHWGYPDMQLTDNHYLALNSDLSKFIRAGKYRHVLCHHPFDVNYDHRVIFDSVMVACRPVPGSTVTGMWSYFVNSSSEWNYRSDYDRFCPNWYVDIGDYLELKLQALRVYDNELRPFPHPRSLEAVEWRAKTFGAEVGLKAAEAFRLHWKTDQ